MPRSPIVSTKYSHFFESHINGVVVNSYCDYLICLRNPIHRAFSAFEWRRKLVLLDEDPAQLDRFPGERQILLHYGSLGEMARSLYRFDGTLDQSVARDFNCIHHLRESISFYLMPLLGILNLRNTLGVICQETFEFDCQNILGVDVLGEAKRCNDIKQSMKLDLDQMATTNLRRFLVSDFQCIAALWSYGLLSKKQFKALMFKSFPGSQ